MKEKIIKLSPYVLVFIIVVYLAVRYDKLNSGSNALSESVSTERTLLHKLFTFEKPEEMSFESSANQKFEGEHSAIIKKEALYGPTFKYDSLDILKKIKRVEVSFRVFSSMPVKYSTIVVAFSNEQGANVIYHNAGMADNFRVNEWSKVFAKFDIDNSLMANEDKLTFAVYTMNDKGEEIYIDNFEVNCFGDN